MMKFSQRVVVLSVAGSLALIYLVLMYMGVLSPNLVPYSEKLQHFLAENPILTMRFSSMSLRGCQGEIKPSSTAVATQDVMKENDYVIYMNGEYNIPHPQLKDAYSADIEPLNVILVPHSHVDPGWIETVDDYYNTKVKKILDNMVRKLTQYEDLTFIWAEIVFFSKWWEGINQMMKDQVRFFIKSGRLEIVLGGWVMPDEASTYYTSVIDQLIEGHQWVMENLYVRPENSWSIDPFGHSGSLPYIWRKSGLKNMVIQRIHQATKGSLVRRKSLEFKWQQFWDHSENSEILCHVMPYILYGLHHTCGPDKFACAMFDFKHLDGEPMFRAIRMIGDENIAHQASILYEQYRKKAGLFQYNTILVPLGDDFRYDDQQEWDQQYENYKKLINYMNGKKEWKINMKFGTLNDYFRNIKVIEKKKDLEFPAVSGDFFPYSDHNSAYWTGYYSTRPFDKRFSREVEAKLRAAEILNTLAYFYGKKWGKKYTEQQMVAEKLRQARRNLGLFLHHDAITGTAKPHVVFDYERKLLEAFNNSQIAAQVAAQLLLSKGKLDNIMLLQPELIRVDPRAPSMHQKIEIGRDGARVVFFNPTAQTRLEFIELIVNAADLEIKNSKNEAISFQIIPIFSQTTQVDASVFEISFLVEIRPLAMETFTLMKTRKSSKGFWSKITVHNSEELIVAPELKFDQERPRARGDKKIYVENQHIGAEFAPFHGTLTKIIDLKTENVTNIKLEFLSYISRGSGAYIFYPNGVATSLPLGTPIVRVIEGPFVSEVQVLYMNLYHRARLYNHPGLQGKGLFLQNALDMQILNMRDRELIMRLSSSVHNADVFFTDQNGFQLIGRKNNKNRNIETNYYPMTSMAMLEDNVKRMTLHSAQSHGVASLDKGWLEVMLDRQLMYDDDRGLGEGIGDNKLTMSKFVLQVEYKVREDAEREEKFTYPSLMSTMQNEFLQQPLEKFFTYILTDVMRLKFNPLEDALPCGMSIVNFRNLVKDDLTHNGTSLILHNRGYKCGYQSDGLLCNTDGYGVDLTQLIPDVKDADVMETTLTHLYSKDSSFDINNLQVSPMELKSFLIKQP